MNTSLKRLPPSGKGWMLMAAGYRTPGGSVVDVWDHVSGLRCLSAVDWADQNPPGSGIVAPHYHVSATFQAPFPRSCTDQEMEFVRGTFTLGTAEEDNHGPGIARHLWLLVGRDREPTCPCKADEKRTVDGPRVRHDPEDPK